jgi:hypothetical protein
MTDGQRSITENGKIARVRIADFVVGCHVEQEPGRIRLHHKLLATKLINHFRVQDCNPIYTTFASGTEVKKSDCCTEEDLKESFISKYKSGVATVTVLYLACTTRPELAKFASELGKGQHRPGRKHFASLNMWSSTLQHTMKTEMYLQHQRNLQKNLQSSSVMLTPLGLISETTDGRQVVTFVFLTGDQSRGFARFGEQLL